MPSVSQKQANLMSAIKHGWKPPAGMHAPPLAVAQEFHAADKKAGKFEHAKGGKVSNLSSMYKYLRQLTEKYLGDLDPETRHAVELYQHSGDNLNEHLWGGEDHGPYNSAAEMEPILPDDPKIASTQHLLAVLDKAFKDAPQVPENIAPYRGMQDLAGPTLFPGYISTTASKRVAQNYADMWNGHGVKRVGVDAGTRVLAPDLNPEWLDEHQKEMILPRGGIMTPSDNDIVKYAPPKMAEGGSVDAPNSTERFLGLVSHAADLASLRNDPHHSQSRVAAGLASQVVGQSPSGHVALGNKPNIINEVASLPAGITDIGLAGSNVLGSLAKKYLPQVPGSAGDLLSRLRDAANAYTDKHGDPAPKWSRDAEEASDAVHQGVNKAMNLSAPRGFVENSAEAMGNMLGQIPLPGAEAKTAVGGVRGGLRALLHAIPEYLGPTVRPGVRNYATGTLGGGALGTLGDSPEPAPLTHDDPYGTMGPKTPSMAKGGKVGSLDKVIQMIRDHIVGNGFDKLHTDPETHGMVINRSPHAPDERFGELDQKEAAAQTLQDLHAHAWETGEFPPRLGHMSVALAEARGDPGALRATKRLVAQCTKPGAEDMLDNLDLLQEHNLEHLDSLYGPHEVAEPHDLLGPLSDVGGNQ